MEHLMLCMLPSATNHTINLYFKIKTSKFKEMAKEKFSVLERLLVKGLLPQQGSMEEQIRVKSIIDKTQLSSEELDELQLSSTGQGGITWNKDKEKPLEIGFAKGEKDLLKNCVDKFDKEGKITQEILPLCQRILKWK